MIELAKQTRREALASLTRYYLEVREEEIGLIAASSLLDFFLQEIGPSLYNKAVADVQQRLQGHISDLDADFHEIEFPYWLKDDRPGGPRPAGAS